jgi:hypothetical protein
MSLAGPIGKPRDRRCGIRRQIEQPGNTPLLKSGRFGGNVSGADWNANGVALPGGPFAFRGPALPPWHPRIRQHARRGVGLVLEQNRHRQERDVAAAGNVPDAENRRAVAAVAVGVHNDDAAELADSGSNETHVNAETCAGCFASGRFSEF